MAHGKHGPGEAAESSTSKLAGNGKTVRLEHLKPQSKPTETSNKAIPNGAPPYQPMGVTFIQIATFSFVFLAQRVVLLILLIEVGKRMVMEV